ncbi:recombination regulator RecX [Bacillus aerolatus]|uniref:Regulatory protein RecX n=1 Tax=Bacillus aerolatus TaxID=2653354 RepID=A0A6I1FAR5_9BACI|nr:recombination regulator RecX [Bacillus aerolatus]KAB7704141.1 recombination regulator RecX [Bacillus aerolatus]
MGVITKISLQQKLKDRYNIFIDEQYAFSVDESVLIQSGLKKGMELTEKEADAIVQQDAVRKGLNAAIQFLSIRMRAEKEVRDYLAKKETETEAIEEIIHSLYRLSYLDDTQFAEAYTKTQINTSDKGPKVIERELKDKGINESIIEETMGEFDLSLQFEKASKLAEKYRKKYSKESAVIQKQKIEQALARKGYGWSVIQEALAESKPEEDEEEQLEALMHQAEKAHRRYSKFSGGEYKQKMKQTLYRKGFSISDIERAIEKLQEE